MPDIDTLLVGYRQGERGALARLLTLVANGELRPSTLIPGPSDVGLVVALTGSGGVGKSTLVGKLIDHLRGKDLTVCVLACDPQSPLSGGALLADRFRMPSRPGDDGVFIRSLAAVGGHGAIADHLEQLVGILQAFPVNKSGKLGFDVVLIETVGAGQGDTAVRDLADVVVLLVQPETGDDLQWEKAGVLEVADVIAVNKADLPGAEQTVAQMHMALGESSMPIVKVSAKTGSGVEELWQAIQEARSKVHRRQSKGQGSVGLGSDIAPVWEALARRVGATIGEGALNQALEDWRAGRLTADAVVVELVRVLGKSSAS